MFAYFTAAVVAATTTYDIYLFIFSHPPPLLLPSVSRSHIIFFCGFLVAPWILFGWFDCLFCWAAAFSLSMSVMQT